MNVKFKRALTIIAVVAFAVTMLVSCSESNSDNADGTSLGTTFTYWISAGVDSSYYANYRESPIYSYLLDKTWPTDHGDVKIDLEFKIPAKGSERDNFNTLLSTGEYCDIMDLSMYSGSKLELYEEGTLLDLTPYVEKYMPNYLAWLDAHPEEKLVATNIVDGEKKYLVLYSVADVGKAWCGYMYRRDWILKYGTSPKDGSAFSGEYTGTLADGRADPESWTDNIVFPSGGSDPVYISDWEWMFKIFDKAMADSGITDGYNISLYYPGYLATGDLVTAFGGGGATWYKNNDNNVLYAPTGDQFRVYLQAMNTWYKNGWIDKAFSEHTSDMFYRIDEAKIRQGKVGMWIGISSQLLNGMDIGEANTKDIVVYPAPNPINDIYGSDEHKYVNPYTMYANSVLGPAYGISDKAKDKDLEALFRFLDYGFSDEGALTGHFTADQIKALNNPIYEKYGLQDGTFREVETSSGIKYMPVDRIIQEGGNLKLAVMGRRGLARDPNSLTLETSVRVEEMRDVWNTYASTGTISLPLIAQLNVGDGQSYSKVEINTTEFLSKSIPPFIRGEKDPFSDADWDAYKNAISKYSPEKATAILQALLDSLK